ncbi:hypothetical protein QFZ22_003680 [Streptomyces canus]|uniref:Uncharacterized protein n=1 Tax=Streptomyces canus TaxID=58343 RepID=A0AAW8FEK9_9ACTN|nr:hypothetical protein [Streptomyces canus]MDQ0907695.1 hypothetical protein [Streptomyces canus]
MSGHRRVWAWAVAVWAALAVVAGVLTLWLQDSAEPPGPYGWEESSPTPALPEGWHSLCPSPTADPGAGPTVVACAFISG